MDEYEQRMSAGQVLAAAEGSIGSAIKNTVMNYYEGHDLSTAQSIRRAPTDTEGAKMVTAMRQGRLLEVLMIGGSAVAGIVAGALAQRAVGNYAVKGVPLASPLGAVPAIAGMAMPLGLSGRSMLAAGGLSFTAGAALYRMLTPDEESAP